MDLFNQNDFLKENSKWIIFLALAVGTFVAFHIFRKVFKTLRDLLKNRNLNSFVKSFLELPIERPLTGIIISIIWQSVVHMMDLPSKQEKPLLILVQLFLAFYVIQLAYLASEAVGEWLRKAAAKTETSMDDQLVPLARKTLKVLVIVLGVLITMQNLGVNVVALLAGLGIGGIALALAAQDTAANLFGSITILADQTYKIGDNIKVGDTEGIVEDIGFRSTQLRTPYKSLVSIPNSTMAKEKIDNLTARTAIRVRHVLGITYDTSPERMEAYVDAIRHMLHLHPLVLKDDIRVFFNNMGDFNLQILVQFFLQTSDPIAELNSQQEILLEIMRIAEKLDVGFAFPTQTLHVESLPRA